MRFAGSRMTSRGWLSCARRLRPGQVLVALLLTMPFWQDAPPPKAGAVANDEVGLVALAAALIPLVTKDR